MVPRRDLAPGRGAQPGASGERPAQVPRRQRRARPRATAGRLRRRLVARRPQPLRWNSGHLRDDQRLATVLIRPTLRAPAHRRPGHVSRPPAPRSIRRTGAVLTWAYFFLPWVLPGISESRGLLVRGGGIVRLVVAVGRHWPPPSGLGRPRDGPAAEAPPRSLTLPAPTDSAAQHFEPAPAEIPQPPPRASPPPQAVRASSLVGCATPRPRQLQCGRRGAFGASATACSLT